MAGVHGCAQDGHRRQLDPPVHKCLYHHYGQLTPPANIKPLFALVAADTTCAHETHMGRPELRTCMQRVESTSQTLHPSRNKPPIRSPLPHNHGRSHGNTGLKIRSKARKPYTIEWMSSQIISDVSPSRLSVPPVSLLVSCPSPARTPPSPIIPPPARPLTESGTNLPQAS